MFLMTKLRMTKQWLATLLFLMATAPALASEHVATLSGLEVVNDGTGDMVLAIGTFTPALPCAKQGLWIIPSEPLYKEMYALLLVAKASTSERASGTGSRVSGLDRSIVKNFNGKPTVPVQGLGGS